jgi:hypothetical protein
MIGDHGLTFDTLEWQDLRNEKLRGWVGDPQAIAFFIAFCDACELFDDVVDKDKPVEDAHATRVLFSLLTELPLNPFFEQWKRQIIPIIVTGINAWLDANELEKGSENDRVFSYVLRDWYVELLAFVIYVTKGRDYMRSKSMEIRQFFTHHETLPQYLEKSP